MMVTKINMMLHFEQKKDVGCGYAVEKRNKRKKTGKIIVTEM